MANNLESNYKLIEALGLALLGSLEDGLVSLTYEATRLLPQGFPTPPWLQTNPFQADLIAKPMTQQFDRTAPSEAPSFKEMDVDPLLKRVAQLAEQLDQRQQAFSVLESRVGRLEEYIMQQSLVSQYIEQPQESAVLDSRLTAIEDSLDSIDLLATELGHRGATSAALDSRVSKLESVVQRVADPSVSQPLDYGVVELEFEGDRAR